jgi:hypothetical protein
MAHFLQFRRQCSTYNKVPSHTSIIKYDKCIIGTVHDYLLLQNVSSSEKVNKRTELIVIYLSVVFSQLCPKVVSSYDHMMSVCTV